LWDDTGLYGCAVIDDKKLNASITTRDGSLWREDSMELFFDTLHDRVTTMNADDYKFFVNILNTQHDAKFDGQDSSWNIVWASAAQYIGTNNNDSDADTGYTLEISIPWSNWGIMTPSENTTWGFDLSLNVKNATGYAQTAWANTDGGGLNDPDGWGEMVFSATTIDQPPSESTPITLNSPNGGEMLPTGTVYEIVWDGPSHAATFDLSYSTDGGTTWKPIVSSAVGKSYAWQVPSQKRNRKNCLLKVTGYDVSKSRIGDDKSDASFTIEVTRLTSPNGGQNLKTTGADAPEKTVVDIAWETYATKNPVASVKLKYTMNGGKTWKLIDEVSGNPGSYSWQLPGAKKLKDKCRVAVVLKDADGKTVGVDGSDDYFTMEPES
jgi:hypothetical protein